MMETIVDPVQDINLSSDFDDMKKKCLTISEYNAIVNWLNSLIKDSTDCVLNKYGWLAEKALSKYPHVHKDTVLSLIDSQVQHYVRHCHHKVFNNVSSMNSPSQSTAATQITDSTTPNQSPVNQKQRSRCLNSKNSMFDKYKELVANSVTSPLITLANNIRMPAMLVAKVVLTDLAHEEKLKYQHDCQQSFNNDDSLNISSILNNSNDVFSDSYSLNDSNMVLAENSNTNDSLGTESDVVSSNIDTQLSKELNWLSSKLLSMREVPTEVLDQSANSSTISNSYCDQTTTKNVNLSAHQLATSTWMISSDPQLAYEVFKCSVMDGYYGSCVEFIKSCTGKRFEELLKQRMTSTTTDTKLLANSGDKKTVYTTEKECRIRGLDMTPDMLLNEPIAIFLTDDDDEHSDRYAATNYIGGSDNGIRVLNWIESKAMFGGPEQLRTAMQRQLFPYWNRHGPGAIIYWFGHVLDSDETHPNLRTDTPKPIVDGASPGKSDSTNPAASNFWSKYCLLMDGFPAPGRIIMHNHWSLKRKNSTAVSKTA